jgi:hypothetical protein
MIRMIVEGEKGKSEDIFWSNLFSKTRHYYKLYFSGGAKSAEYETRQLCKDLQSGDIVILGLDKYTWREYNKCYKLLQQKRTKQAFALVAFTARSFEGMFLSYMRLPALVRLGNRALQQPFLDVAASLRKRERLGHKLKLYASHIQQYGLTPDIKTEERFVAWLLGQVTHSPTGIRVEKGFIGNCWLIDCCVAQVNTKNACPQKGTVQRPFWNKIQDMESLSVMVHDAQKLTKVLLT